MDKEKTLADYIKNLNARWEEYDRRLESLEYFTGKRKTLPTPGTILADGLTPWARHQNKMGAPDGE